MKDNERETPIDKPSYLPPLKLEPEQYGEHFDEFDPNNEQQIEFLQTLWHMMATFVDIGWNVESVQMFLPDLFEKAGQDSDKLLRLEDTQTIKPSGGQHDE